MSKTENQMAVIFDLDGVLVDTSEFHRQSWYDLAEKEGFAMTDELFYATFGMQNYQIIPKLIDRDMSDSQVNRLGDWKEQRYRDLIKGRLTLMPGVKRLLDDLKAAGFLLAIGSSAPPENLTFMLEQTGSAGIFDAFATAEDVQNGKPAPDTFLRAAEKLSVPPARCVVVEDAVQGVQAGKNARMAVVAVTSTRARHDLKDADLIVDSLSELSAEDFRKLLKNSI